MNDPAKATEPTAEQRPHIMDASCWCNPTVEYVPAGDAAHR